jgi:hypothetical protein
MTGVADVRVDALERGQRLRPVVDDARFEAFFAEQEGQWVGQRFFILDDQYVRQSESSSSLSGSMGMYRLNVEPVPGLLHSPM